MLSVKRHPTEHVIPSGHPFVIIINRFWGNNLITCQPIVLLTINSLIPIFKKIFDSLIERKRKEYITDRIKVTFCEFFESSKTDDNLNLLLRIIHLDFRIGICFLVYNMNIIVMLNNFPLRLLEILSTFLNSKCTISVISQLNRLLR